jgi:hypothetical protein
MNDSELSYELNPINVGGGQVFFNPGSGAIKDPDEAQAFINMKQFLLDSPVRNLYFRRVADKDYGDGRYAFLVLRDDKMKVIEVQMPGLPLDKVRYMGLPNQDIWEFPRLYIDGSSWIWEFAIIDDEHYIVEDDED